MSASSLGRRACGGASSRRCAAVGRCSRRYGTIYAQAVPEAPSISPPPAALRRNMERWLRGPTGAGSSSTFAASRRREDCRTWRTTARSLGCSPISIPCQAFLGTPMRHRDTPVGAFFLAGKQGGGAPVSARAPSTASRSTVSRSRLTPMRRVATITAESRSPGASASGAGSWKSFNGPSSLGLMVTVGRSNGHGGNMVSGQRGMC